MNSCNNCIYGSSKNHTFVICKFFNKVIDTRKNNVCSSHKSKNMKYKTKKI